MIVHVLDGIDRQTSSAGYLSLVMNYEVVADELAHNYRMGWHEGSHETNSSDE